MTKADFVRVVANKVGLSQNTVSEILTAMTDTVVETVASGDSVRFVDFGTFSAKERSARVGRNPQTKEEIQIPATRAVAFKPAKAFKDAVAK